MLWCNKRISTSLQSLVATLIISTFNYTSSRGLKHSGFHVLGRIWPHEGVHTQSFDLKPEGSDRQTKEEPQCFQTCEETCCDCDIPLFPAPNSVLLLFTSQNTISVVTVSVPPCASLLYCNLMHPSSHFLLLYSFPLLLVDALCISRHCSLYAERSRAVENVISWENVMWLL